MKHIAAALIFFTRLPLGRLKTCATIPSGYFGKIIGYWTITGWLTGGIMAGVLWLTARILPYEMAVVFAITARLLLTGALHEDGLADFLDGFGGGKDRESILSIMKDSHIGTYGVIGLILYFLLLFLSLYHLPPHMACTAILMADPFCKLISSQIVLFLPYARTVETAKSKVIYEKTDLKAQVLSLLFGLVPLFLLPTFKWLIIIFLPLTTGCLLLCVMKKKINGYTGDCCGALFLMCELSFLMGISLCYRF